MERTYYDNFSEILKEESLTKVFEIIAKKFDTGPNPIANNIFIQAYNSEILQEMYNLRPDLTPEQIEYYQMLTFVMYHQWKDQNFFSVSPNIITKLNDTDIDNISSLYVTCPYRSMYIVFPKNAQLMDLEQNYITHISLLYFISETPREFILNKIEKSTILTNKYIYVLAYNDIEKGTGSFYSFPLRPNNIKAEVEFTYDYLKEHLSRAMPKDSIIMILKLLLYINCTNVNIKEIIGMKYPLDFTLKKPKKQKRLAHRYKKHSRFNYKYIDTPIIPHCTVPSIKNDDKNILTTPQKVRGHFKQQHYGKNWEDVKTIWIMPYNRGDLSLGFNNRRDYKIG